MTLSNPVKLFCQRTCLSGNCNHIRYWYRTLQAMSSTTSYNAIQRYICSSSIFREHTETSMGSVSFQALGVTPSLCRSLKEEGILVPSLIQCEALPVTFARTSNCIIQSETGTGKTLTFLLPALQEQVPSMTTLILVPTRELAIQIQYQARKLVGQDKRAKRVLAMYSGIDDKDLVASYMERRPNILIGTPKRILELLKTNLKDFTSLRRLVLDEVDKLLLLPKKKGNLKKRLMRDVHPRPTNLIVPKLLSLQERFRMQLIASSATVDEHLKEELVDLGWTQNLEIISTNESSRELISPDTIKHLCLNVEPYNTWNTDDDITNSRDKIDTLLEHFKSSGENSALVFIHRNAPITQFVYDLQQRGIKTTALHENVSSPTQYAECVEKFESGEIELMVATEETVRGLDFAWLSTVYLMVVPRTAKDYLHLCGRVGRVGQHGRAVVIVEDERERKRIEAHYKRLGVDGMECTR